MKKALLLALHLLPLALLAQVKITGTVKDGRGKPVPGASISILNSYDGGVADSSGKFSFITTEKGEQKLQVNAVGYKSAEQVLTLQATGTLELQFSIKEQIDELKAVVVTAGTFAAGDAKRGAVMTSLDIATTGGAGADITAAFKTLPGAQQVNDQEGLFVRGGAGYETKQFIDGTMVNNPYFSSVQDIAQRGRFSPFLFKGMVFATGGYSALYGQALSAALVMESIDIPERSEIDAGISPLFASLGTQHVAANKKSSWGVSYNYVNVAAYFKLVKQTPDYFKVPQFHNIDGNFRIKTKGGIIKYYTTFSSSSLGLRRPDIDSVNLKDAFDLNNYNWYNNLSWRENLGGGWKMQLGAGFSANRDNIWMQVQDANNQPKQFLPGNTWMNNKNYNLYNRQTVAQLRAVFEKRLTGINSIRFGSEYWYSENPLRFRDTTYNITDNYNALFAEANFYVTNDLAFTLGSRLEHASVINKTALAPRAAMAYKLGKESQLSFAYGMFYQKPENMELRYGGNMGFTKATHYILNYTKSTRLQMLRLEAFYKKYNQLVKTFPDYNTNGYGYARGAELFWRDRKTMKFLDYWVSYSYLDTKRDYQNFPVEMNPNFAATHTFSIVTKRFITAIKTGFNLTYSFATGRPYYNLMLNNMGTKYDIADMGTTTTFKNLGFSVNYVPSAGKVNAKTNMVLVANVSNVLGNTQLSGYRYSYDGTIKQPILPPAKRSFMIGLFISWGVDRTDDIINNNL